MKLLTFKIFSKFKVRKRSGLVIFCKNINRNTGKNSTWNTSIFSLTEQRSGRTKRWWWCCCCRLVLLVSWVRPIDRRAATFFLYYALETSVVPLTDTQFLISKHLRNVLIKMFSFEWLNWASGGKPERLTEISFYLLYFRGLITLFCNFRLFSTLHFLLMFILCSLVLVSPSLFLSIGPTRTRFDYLIFKLFWLVYSPRECFHQEEGERAPLRYSIIRYKFFLEKTGFPRRR